jgi:choloylglycine hydrolase
MVIKRLIIILLGACMLVLPELEACSVLYYIDQHTGKIYLVNNEDYWYDVDAYIEIRPGKANKLARLWYGWDKFAQGGINEAGLVFDGAVTPEQVIPQGYRGPKSNLGDQILSRCHNVDEALLLLEKEQIALNNAHMMLGDSTGRAVVVEWIQGQKKLIEISGNRLIMTNYLLSDPDKGNYPCPRYQSIEERLLKLENSLQPMDLKLIGNTMGGAVQPPRTLEDGRMGGTLYTSFIGISDMEFVLVYKLDNQRVTHLDLREEFAGRRKKRIKLI